MKNTVISVPAIREPIQPSPGFAKKQLADYKLDLIALCGFGCTYCSSNTGNYLRINRRRFADLAEQQTGSRLTPFDSPSLTYVWPEVLDNLEAQLANKPRSWGIGQTLVFSMQTDAFSPPTLKAGVTRRALDLVLERTSFRVRVLTKNSIVGTRPWVDFFRGHPGRFVVGLSCGSLDDSWAARVEVGASLPSARLRALHVLQDAGVPTFGMLCPVFPSALGSGQLEELLDRTRPERTETVWCEIFNDRSNWEHVLGGLEVDGEDARWVNAVFGRKDRDLWSRTAVDALLRLRQHAELHGWGAKLRYLLYEGNITRSDAERMGDLCGVLPQSKPDADGFSSNPHIRALQQAAISNGGGAR